MVPIRRHVSSIIVVILTYLAPPTQAQILVMAPKNLKNMFDNGGRIDGSTATFGAPFYGERILGQVVWSDSRGEDHCKDDDYEIAAPEQIETSYEYKEVKLIQIVMVRRGHCSFVTKVKVAKQKGAHAVIIVDKESSSLSAQDIRRIIVADDGYGEKVDIPSILISKQDGQNLIDATKKGKVVVELAWDIPTNHIVDMDMWMSSGSSASLQFLKDFSPKRKALNEWVRFRPHYHIFALQGGQDFHDMCWDDDAQYCAEDPDMSGRVTGKMVLEEDVRQLCIHQETKVSRGGAETWSPERGQTFFAGKYWDYVEILGDECPFGGTTPDRQFGRPCSQRLMKKVGIDLQKIDQCMIERQSEFLKKQRDDTAWSPRALRINGWRYSGSLNADVVTRAMCAGFIQQPDACTSLLDQLPKTVQILAPPPSGGVGLGTLVGTLLVVGIISVGVVLLYKRSLTRSIHTALREEVMLEVQAQMDSYKQLPS